MMIRFLALIGLFFVANVLHADPILLKCETYIEQYDHEQTEYWAIDLENEEIHSETHGYTFKIISVDDYTVIAEMEWNEHINFKVHLDRRTLDLAMGMIMEGSDEKPTKYQCEVAPEKKL